MTMPSAQSTSNQVPEYMEQPIQNLAENVFGHHSLECTCVLLDAFFTYDIELRMGDTFIHRMAQYNQVNCVVYMLDCGADPDTKTAIVHPEFPCKIDHMMHMRGRKPSMFS